MSLVFYSPARRRQDEAERQRAVDRLGVLHRGDVPHLQALLDEAAALCTAPMAAISTVDQDRQWFAVKIGLDVRGTSRSLSFCAHSLREPSALLCVPDARADPRFAGNQLV